MKELKFRLLEAEEIECRVSQCNEYGVGLLLYKDARCDQNILDETVGAMNWQRSHLRDNANCVVSIWDDVKKQWIGKEDTGKESNTEAEKGLASDSFKRACFNWGIGRELYTAPNMFVRKNNLKTHTQYNGRWICKDTFKVLEIEYSDKKIVYVKILNQKTEGIIEFGMPLTEQQKTEELKKTLISTVKIKALLARCEKDNVDPVTIERLYKVKDIAELNEYKYANINTHWEEIIAKDKEEKCK